MQRWAYALAMAGVGPVTISVTGQKPTESSYLDLKLGDQSTVVKVLELMGERGWELVTVLQYGSTSALYFKRPVE